MKAIGEVHYRSEKIYDPTKLLSLFQDDSTGRRVSVISVLLHPVLDFCPGMAYEQMEVLPGDPARTIKVDLDITSALIEYLWKQGETEIAILHQMVREIAPKQMTLFD